MHVCKTGRQRLKMGKILKVKAKMAHAVDEFVIMKVKTNVT